ncbi:MAG: sulfatase-like hydrolase/transferase [Planctomycetaceae bacterium]
MPRIARNLLQRAGLPRRGFVLRLAALYGLGGMAVAANPSNFVVIMADDLGAGELGCYGHPEHHTPQLDRLADEGVRFRTCFATPNCSPSRMMLMTGRYGFRTGWYDFLERELSPAPGSPQFDIGEAEITFADVLKSRGYATGIAGKWQLPGSPANRIYDCGFDTYCMWMWKHPLPDIDPVTGVDRTPYDPAASLHAGQGRGNRYWDPDIMVNRKRLPTKAEDYGPDIFAGFVCDFMRTHRSEPFVIYYPMALIHQHGGIWPPVPDRAQPGRRTAAGLRPNVEYMDHLVGRVCQAIDELGLRESTYVLFTGDNGTGDDGKGEVIERGARVPLIVRGPGIPPGVVTDELADLTDVFPTLAELAGAPLPTDRTIDGVSLAPTLLGRSGPRREWIFSYLADARMLRDKRWLREGDGRFYDCGSYRDGSGYKYVSDSADPAVKDARRRFERILEELPPPPSVSQHDGK